MPYSISAYILCFNNRDVIVEAVRSVAAQTVKPTQIFVVDDGSTDGSPDMLEAQGIRVFRQERNLGRGAARHRAMQEAHTDLVLCCDATNVLPPDFVQQALHWFDDSSFDESSFDESSNGVSSVAAVFGRITDPAPRGVVARWRARHLFKTNAEHAVAHQANLGTYGAIVRAATVSEVGGYHEHLRHSEDHDLGLRLLEAKHDVICDPSLLIIANAQNTLLQVLERYWRWYAGKDERFSFMMYLRALSYSIKWMALQDLQARDPLAAGISLLLPHYQLWRYAITPKQP